MSNSIPVSTIVAVQPNVLGAGGSALNVIGLFLTNGGRVPIGTVAAFESASAVSAYFGAGAAETAYANVYFQGYNGSAVTPQNLLYAQYNQSAVSAFLRGGNIATVSLSTLQGYSGTLAITVDGYPRSGSVTLTAATSFSSAAGIIETALNGSEPTEAVFTGSFGASFTGTATGTSLAVTAVTGYISVGDVLSGTGITAGSSIVAQASGTTGGAGTYTLNHTATSSAASLVSTSAVVNVSAVNSGTIAIGQTVTGTSIPPNTVIVALGTGTSGAGTYLTSLTTATQISVASESMDAVGTNVVVSFDSVSGGFVITSGITGTPSSIAYPTTSTIATNLLLTGATGAVISQGAVAATPSAFMNNIVGNVTQNWVTFATTFDPDDGEGNAQKLLFAEWVNGEDDGYVYVCADTDSSPTVSVPAESSLGYLIGEGDYSGTCLVYQPSELYLAAFVCGVAASIDFSETNGRITFKFRTQTGITPSVTSETIAANLTANGYNYYGSYASRTQQFQFFANGVVSGPFTWLDSYINQIWLNNALQEAILAGLQNVNSIPYNSSGNALIEAFCADPINAALQFGAIVPGVALSAAQTAEVNNAAGTAIATTLQNRGWYLQILPATASVRAARQSPPCTLWYTDGGSVQQIDLDSIDVQ